MTVSLVARQHGVAASQLFLWRKQYQEGSLTAVAAGEQVSTPRCLTVICHFHAR
ncbi:tpnC protein [Escherichia coli DEC9E]|nr:tpnC protein [Escherichia coli DEC9E]